jgi:ADP-heptose:LPS heptosyltransferase
LVAARDRSGGRKLRRLTKTELDGIRKALVIQLGPFGDGLLTTSYFETFKRHLPHAALYYLIKEPYDEIVRGHPFIDRLMVIRHVQGLGYALERLRVLLMIRREGFDIVIDQQNMPSSQQLTLLSGARYRLGYADARFSWAYNLKAGRGPLRYSGGRKYDILEPLGIQEEPYRLCFDIPSADQRSVEEWLRGHELDPARLVLVSPGSPVEKKKWKPESYARLADLIQRETAYRVALLCGPGEEKDVRAVCVAMATKPVLVPQMNIRWVGALLARCALLVCNDGGLNHLSVATGTSALALFGNSDPVVWSPASAFKDHYHLYNPNFDSAQDRSFGILPEEAFARVGEILGEHAGKA